MTASLPERAERYARSLHAGQVDKQGRPYADAHLLPIAESLTSHGDEAVAAGWLHDVIEDTEATHANLCEQFGALVADAVESCTRRPGEPYAALIERAAANPLGRLVKLADNAHNIASNPSLAQLDPKRARSLLRRYEKARAVLLAAA